MNISSAAALRNSGPVAKRLRRPALSQKVAGLPKPKVFLSFLKKKPRAKIKKEWENFRFWNANSFPKEFAGGGAEHQPKSGFGFRKRFAQSER